MVRTTLGPLIAHDKSNEGELVTSVRVFLRNDGAWQKSADEFNIHRQTLVYRLRRVEQLTGLKPTSTEGSAMFWLALPRPSAPNFPSTTRHLTADANNPGRPIRAGGARRCRYSSGLAAHRRRR